MRSSFEAFTVTSSLFCPLSPSSCSPASSTAIGFQGGGCWGRTGKSPGLAPGWPARGQSCQEQLALVHFLASTSLGWLPGAKVFALTGDSCLLCSAREDSRIMAGSASCPTSAERHAHRSSCLPSPSCLGPHSQRSDLQAATLHGLPHLHSLQGHLQVLHSPCSRSTLPALPFQHQT